MTSVKRTCVVFILLIVFVLIPVEAFETRASPIGSRGSISYSIRGETIVLRSYTGTYSFNDISVGAIAELYDVCQAWKWASDKIQQVHRIRHDFVALLYRNMRAINRHNEEWQMALNSNWILKDSDGQPVYVTAFPNLYFVDIGNQEYQKWIAEWTRENIDYYGFDGVFADVSFYATAVTQFHFASTTPINPRTGESWKDEEVRQAFIGMHKEIKEAIGSKLLVCNGIYHGHRFWRQEDQYMELLSNSPLDGIMSEGLWYQYQGAWMTEERWLESLDFLVFIQDKFLEAKSERIFVPICKLTQLPSDCTRQQMITYAFASTLLGISTSQNCLGLVADAGFFSQFIKPLFDVNLGFPVNDYYPIKGSHVYARDFSNVKVLVNPSSSSYVIDLQGEFATLSGTTLTHIEMEDHTGAILVKE